MIHRTEHKDGFLIVSPDILKSNLSEGAKIVLLFMLSLPDDWNFNINGLATCLNMSASKVGVRVKELQESGYITIKKNRNPNGKISSWYWDVYEKPLPENPDVEISRCGENHKWLEQDVVLPDVVNRDDNLILNKTNTNNKPILKETNKSVSENFELILENLVPDSEVKEAFREFIKVRKKQKNRPFTEHALKLLIKKAEKLGNGNPETMKKIVEQSIERGWSGLFPIKEPTPINKFEPDENPFAKLAREEGYSI